MPFILCPACNEIVGDDPMLDADEVAGEPCLACDHLDNWDAHLTEGEPT